MRGRIEEAHSRVPYTTAFVQLAIKNKKTKDNVHDTDHRTDVKFVTVVQKRTMI